MPGFTAVADYTLIIVTITIIQFESVHSFVRPTCSKERNGNEHKWFEDSNPYLDEDDQSSTVRSADTLSPSPRQNEPNPGQSNDDGDEDVSKTKEQVQ